MTFQERIRALREDRDLTQEQLGNMLNMTQRRISYLETEGCQAKQQDIIDYCKFFNVSADYILGFTNEIKPLPQK